MKKRYYNKWLIFILCLGLLVPQGFRISSTQVKAAQTGTVTARSLNVRTKPSTSSNMVQVDNANVYLVQGEQVEILEEAGEWYYVLLTFNGKPVKGYVHGDYIKKDKAEPTPKPTATPKPTQVPEKETSGNYKYKAMVTSDTLNVRKGPGVKYAAVEALAKGDIVTITSEDMNGTTKWYGITYTKDNKTKTGYVSSIYVKLSFDDTIKGKIETDKVKIRKAASSNGAYVKSKSGTIISLDKGKNITILDETMSGIIKWFKISFTQSGEKYTGYILANDVRLQSAEAKPTATPTPKPTATPTPKPTKAPASTPTPTVIPTPKVTEAPSKEPTVTPTLTPTPTPTATPTPTPTPTATPTPTPTSTPTLPLMPMATPTPPATIVEIPDIVIYETITESTGYVVNTVYLNIVADILSSRALLLDGNNEPVLLTNSAKVRVINAVNEDDRIWYHIEFDYFNQKCSGYVRAEYIYIGAELPNNPWEPSTSWPTYPSPSPIPSQMPTVSPTPTLYPGWQDPDDASFELSLLSEGFPESYKQALRELHYQYPNWKFKAYHTGLDWDYVISQESIPGKNLIPNGKSVEWKSFDPGAYNWKTDTFTVYDGSTWVTASKEAIEYYMDPRNHLDPEGIFQFELLRYQSEYQNAAGVENILKGTALYNTSYTYTDDNGIERVITYAETFIAAAEYSGVSPYHLASRVKQEVVTGPNTLSNSVSGTYKGYEGLYNFYNIGANDSPGGGAIANGLKYARNGSKSAEKNALYMISWTNPFRSIVGGSYFLGSSYINIGQDTVYLQKFNVTPRSTFFHQYMTNVEAPWAEAKKIAAAYKSMGDVSIVFSIPVYLNMPANPAPRPTTQFNPNNRLKSLKVYSATGEELTITPTFDQTVKEYGLIVNNNVELIEIKATTVSKKATLVADQYAVLNVGHNRVVVTVIAENGNIAEYVINVVREE